MILLIFFLFLISGGQMVAQRVAGLLHHSVEFYHPDLSLLVVDVIWLFLTQNEKTKMVMYHKDQLSIYNTQFTDRLEVSHKGTKLRINNLRMEDTGVYIAEITFTDHEIRHVHYVLTVYEPVPAPAIWTEVMQNPKKRCNVTLHCSVPSNKLDFSYTWKYRLQDSEYQDMDSTGSSIQISQPPDHQDMDVTCIVQNPTDQKNISITVTSCFSTDGPSHRKVFHDASLTALGYVFFILLLTALLILMLMEGKKGDWSVSSVWIIFALNMISLLTFILVMRLAPIFF